MEHFSDKVNYNQLVKKGLGIYCMALIMNATIFCQYQSYYITVYKNALKDQCTQIKHSTNSHATAQVVSFQLPTTKAQVQSQVPWDLW
jgi:hypothetical protein